MSAFLQTRTHIGAIVRWAILQYSEKAYLELDDYEAAERVCQMLAEENVKSIQYRYPDTVANPEKAPGSADPLTSIMFNPSFAGFGFSDCPLLEPGEILVAIDGLVYQSCEHPGWATSKAREWLHRLYRVAVRQLPQYQKAQTWAINDEDDGASPRGKVISITELMEGR